MLPSFLQTSDHLIKTSGVRVSDSVFGAESLATVVGALLSPLPPPPPPPLKLSIFWK